MLTKDLVRFSLKGNAIKPDFIDPAKPALLGLAETMLELFRASVGKTRSQIEEESKLIIDASETSAIFARGLEKLLFDRLDFETTADDDLISWRHQLFLESSKLLSEQPFATLSDFHTTLTANHHSSAEQLAQRLFSDLPENQPVTRFRSLSAERLLHRYNAALVQWMLLHAHSLTISTAQQDTKAWRQFFRHLRFHQLLAEISRAKSGTFTITVDGPMSLFQQTKKYGLSLATFFPAVLHLAEWKLVADIHLRNRKPKRLLLDETAGLRPYSGHFLAHIPQEIAMFQQLFHEQETDWSLAPSDDFIALPGDAYGFADFTLSHSSGKVLGLELFHTWHGGPLTHRLHQLADLGMAPPLVIGVDRKLIKDPAIAAQLEASAYFQQWGFLFRDMPSPKAVLKIVEGLHC